MSCQCKYPICLNQRATFVLPILYEYDDGDPIDITGYTAIMQVREFIDDDDVILEASTENGYITMDEENGTFVVSIPTSVTDDLEAPFEGVYDLFVTAPNGDTEKILFGPFKIEQAVTR